MLLEINSPILEERSRYDGVSLKRLARWSQEYTWRNADLVLSVTKVEYLALGKAIVAPAHPNIEDILTTLFETLGSHA